MIARIAILIPFLLCSCSGPYAGKDLYGADEFVMDSYRIREGKSAILEMEGQECRELDECLLEECGAIGGEVELAGLVNISCVPVDGKMRLFDVLAKAEVPPDANLFMSYLIRANELIPVDMHRLVRLGDMSQNIVMHGGDKIYIADAAAATLMVMGEVERECVISLPAGFMPLRRALAEAGGIPYTGDRSYIQVIRGGVINPKIYTLSWEHLIHLPNDSLLLMPGDIVYVAAKPIAEWHRFISQLLPSICGAYRS